jgi:hypothetical protein
VEIYSKVGNRNAPEDASHLWLLAKMLTAYKRESSLLFRFTRYVIAACHLKIKRRFVTPKSKKYLRFFSSVQLDDIDTLTIRAACQKRKRLYVELQNDQKFLNILGKGDIVPRYQEQFPAIAQVFKELTSSNTTDSSYSINTFELFTGTTYREYHSLFNTLLNGYKELVEEIADKAKKRESFGVDLNSAVQTGHALLTMVKGRAFYLYLSTIKSKLSSSVRNVEKESNVEESNADAEEREEDRNDTPLWDSAEPNDPMTPFKGWIMLMLVQLDAADALCAFVKQAELSKAEIDVKIVYSSLVSSDIIPLEDLLLKLYIPGAPGDPANEKLHHFIETAKAVEGHARRLDSFVNEVNEVWDPKCAPKSKLFIEMILGYYKKERGKGEQGDLKKHITPTLVTARKIHKLLSLPPSVDSDMALPLLFSDLQSHLNDRRAKYCLPFYEKTAFKGALHCEACLASILDKTTRDSIQARINALKQANKLNSSDLKLYESLEKLLKDTKVGFFSVHLVINPSSNSPSQDFTRVIGVSKRCCPVCRYFLSLLSLRGDPATTGIVTPGFHDTISTCTLPEWTPEPWVDAMNLTFGQLLRNELMKISDAVRLDSISRPRSAGSGVSVGNSDTVVGDMILG